MNKQAKIDWCYSDYDGYSEKKELSALRKLLKASLDFEDAKFTYKAALDSSINCFDVLKGALMLAAKCAKRYDEHLFVMVHSEYGTPQYEKAVAGATQKATCQYDMEQIGIINARKAGKHLTPEITWKKEKAPAPIQVAKKVTAKKDAPSAQLSLF